MYFAKMGQGCYIAVVLFIVVLGTTQFGTAQKCYQDDGRPSWCMPELINAAFEKDIYANNTCGVKKASHYCVHSGHIGLQRTCEICDSRNKTLEHPARYMNDIVQEIVTWWQSDTLFDNKYPVRIILDLGKTFDITFVWITFHSARPESFAIYKKSSTAKDDKWIPFQYYSQSCMKNYRVSPYQFITRRNQKVALCSEKYSRILPLSWGTVAFSTLEKRPERFGFDRSPALQEWVTVASLRIDLDRLNTFGDEVFGDPDVLRSYYFAISNLMVGGRCKCNGHASECLHLGKEKPRLKCKCDHNTDGDDCEKCLPLYNDTPWKRATRYSANPCSPCNCNGLAQSCVFDLDLYKSTGRGGRCINCNNNTDGVNCEKCKLYHYRKFTNEACKPCNCDPVGSKRAQCNSDGQCACNPGVFGKKCDACRPGY
ncbi:laminin subunit gamma-1-like [Rhopilema esculentum]|uniref:laminin subunit gamma-1-like n=1 Tax=Rhopilema esculentum TaxID=499914 RepID=UPI0031CE15D0